MTTASYIKHNKLSIAAELHQLVSDEICPGTGITPEHFFTELEQIIACLLYTSPSPRDRG